VNPIKLIAIGDLHGRTCWKEINPSDYDKIVFLGDYCDDHSIKPPLIIDNLKDVIDFKKQNSAKVILLLGNHDIQYSEFPNYMCSGFNEKHQPEYSKLFDDNRDQFVVAYQVANYLFTHAGVTNRYMSHYFPNEYAKVVSKEISPAILFNDIDKTDRQYLLHTIGSARGGYDFAGGITWADISESEDDALEGYHQVVGHNRVRDFLRLGNDSTSITYIDVLHTRERFLEVNIVEPPST
jgi:predicted MPP superfamily phosphohydrolase